MKRSGEESIVSDLKEKLNQLKLSGVNIPAKVEKIQIDSFKQAKKIGDNVSQLEDVNERVALVKAVSTYLINEIGLNFNGRMLMMTEIMQAEIGLSIIDEKNKQNEIETDEDPFCHNASGPSYVN